MIKKERLQELIEKGATIFGIDCVLGTSEMREIALNEDMFIGGDYLYQYDWCISIKDLYETQEQAEWVSKMHTERTEKFEPPTWEEFEREPKFNFWINKVDGLGGLYCIEKSTHIMFEEDGKEYEKEKLEVSATLIEEHKIGSGYFYCRDYTKENYEKAVEYAKALFEGKENDNETDSDK